MSKANYFELVCNGCIRVILPGFYLLEIFLAILSCWSPWNTRKVSFFLYYGRINVWERVKSIIGLWNIWPHEDPALTFKLLFLVYFFNPF